LALPLFNEVHEVASPAVIQFLCVRALDLSAAEGTCDRPAGSAGVLSAMGPAQFTIGRDRAYAEFLCFISAWLPSGIFYVPSN